MTVDVVLRHEERVQRGAHPFAYPALRALRNRPAVRVPGLGVVVSDAATAREVLMKIRGFNKKHPGVMISANSLRRSMQSRENFTAKAVGGIVVNPKLQRETNEAVRFGQ